MKYAAILGLSIIVFLSGCATPAPQKAGSASHMAGQTKIVRTTAYTSAEPGGAHDAVGGRLKCGTVNSAAADWSRFPVGTRFQIVETGQICEIDDYGSALVGTNTIDLFRDSGRGMRTWGVRMVHINILEWGSPRRSLEILTPRCRSSHIRSMVAALKQQSQGTPVKFHRIQS